MLTKMEIKGFRSFSQESIQQIFLEPFTVLVGENDTGKSNVLKAILFALNPSVKGIVREDFNIRKSKSRSGKIIDKKAREILIRLHFSNPTKLLPQKYQRKNYHPKSGSFVIECTATGSENNGYKKEYFLNGKKILDPELLLSKIKFYITPSIRDVDYLNEIKKALPIEKSSLINQAVKKFIQAVKSKVRSQEAIIKQATGVEKAIIDPVIDIERALKVLEFDFSIIKDSIPIHLKYHGQGMVSKIILALFLKQSTKHLLGVEEPEIHMHPNLIREIVFKCEELVKKKTQIIVVTHSPYFINFVKAKNILVSKKVNKYTKISKIVPPDDVIARCIESDVFLNRQKTEILFARGVVLVEGPYDRRGITIIDSKAGMNSFNCGIGVIDVGGSNFKPYIELCIQAEIPWVIIADASAYFDMKKNTRSFVLKAIEGHVKEKILAALEDKIKNAKACRKELKEVNDVLRIKKGYICYLSGQDISDTIVKILQHKNDDNLYSSLYNKFGGHSKTLNSSEIRVKVEETIGRKKEKMIDSLNYIPFPHEIERVFKQSINAVKKLIK